MFKKVVYNPLGVICMNRTSALSESVIGTLTVLYSISKFPLRCIATIKHQIGHMSFKNVVIGKFTIPIM